MSFSINITNRKARDLFLSCLLPRQAVAFAISATLGVVEATRIYSVERIRTRLIKALSTDTKVSDIEYWLDEMPDQRSGGSMVGERYWFIAAAKVAMDSAAAALEGKDARIRLASDSVDNAIYALRGGRRAEFTAALVAAASRALGPRCRFDPSWRTDTAVSLAKGMHESHNFSAMPILADALQDAGCEEEVILAPLRGGKNHTAADWVLWQLMDGSVG